MNWARQAITRISQRFVDVFSVIGAPEAINWTGRSAYRITNRTDRSAYVIRFTCRGGAHRAALRQPAGAKTRYRRPNPRRPKGWRGPSACRRPKDGAGRTSTPRAPSRPTSDTHPSAAGVDVRPA